MSLQEQLVDQWEDLDKTVNPLLLKARARWYQRQADEMQHALIKTKNYGNNYQPKHLQICAGITIEHILKHQSRPP